MCTAATYKTKDFYFGRTLDYEFSYGDEITITPRNFPFKFRHTNECNSHFAMIGMAHIADGYPLYYDAMNEKGLCMAGLNFVGNAVYFEPKNGKENIAQFEFIPYILSHCDSSSATSSPVLNCIGLFPTETNRLQLNRQLTDSRSMTTLSVC